MGIPLEKPMRQKWKHNPAYYQYYPVDYRHFYGYDTGGTDFYADIFPVINRTGHGPELFGIVMVLNMCIGICIAVGGVYVVVV